MIELTQTELKQILDYDPEKGIFRWKIQPRYTRINIGDIAGTLRPDGYIIIRINGKNYLAHRFAWFYMTGQWPLNQIDHINQIKNDNRISNLRDLTHQENSFNRGEQKNNTSGFKGVSEIPSGKWKAQIQVNGKKIYLGLFNTREAASMAYQKAKEKYHKI